MSRQMALDDFERGERPSPPVVHLDNGATEAVQSPHADKLAGFIAPSNRNCRVYSSRRVHASHYYYAEGGYPLSKSILHYLGNEGVNRLVIWEASEKGDGNIYEFNRSQYLEDGVPVTGGPKGDPQLVVPADDALYRWLGYGNPEIDHRNHD